MRTLTAGTALAALVLAGLVWLAAFLFSDPAYFANEAANERFARGELRGALAAYRDLQQRRADLPQLGVNAANALHRLDELARALGDYERALASAEPRIAAVTLYDRGNTLYRLGRVDEARASYVAALRADPGIREAKFNIEVLDRIQEEARQRREAERAQRAQQGQQGQPSQQGQPQNQQGQPQQGGQPQPGGPQGPAPDPRTGQPQGAASSPGPNVNQALTEFRRTLTPDEALRVLDALRREQRGIQGLLEGQRAPRPPGAPPEY